MIRRTFVSLCSSLAFPLHVLKVRSAPESETTSAPPHPSQRGSGNSVSSVTWDPDWVHEWRKIPKREVFEENLSAVHDFAQRVMAARVLSHIHNGAALEFRFYGGTEPGLLRKVLPIWLFQPDSSNQSGRHAGDSPHIHTPQDASLYLQAWCLARSAPRTFRLDRMEWITVL